MFKIIYDQSNRDRIAWMGQFKTIDYPNFSLIDITTDKLEVGTRFILKDNNDNSLWYGEWSVGIRSRDSFRIKKIINIDDYLNATKRVIEYTSDSIFNSDYYYIFDLNIGDYIKNIFEYEKFDVYKLPTNEWPRDMLISTSFYNVNRERDIEYLTNIYMNIDSDDLTNYKCRYNKYNMLEKFNIVTLKREIKLNNLLRDV